MVLKVCPSIQSSLTWTTLRWGGGGVKESDPCTGQTAIMPFKLLTNLTAMLFEPTSARNEVKLTSEWGDVDRSQTGFGGNGNFPDSNTSERKNVSRNVSSGGCENERDRQRTNLWSIKVYFLDLPTTYLQIDAFYCLSGTAIDRWSFAPFFPFYFDNIFVMTGDRTWLTSNYKDLWIVPKHAWLLSQEFFL